MRAIKFPKSLLIKLENIGLSIKTDNASDALRIGTVNFRPENKPTAYDSLSSQHGFFLKYSTAELRRNLENKSINYLDKNGNLFIKSKNLKLNIQETKPTSKKVKTKSSIENKISTTTLVSPYSFSIIDVLFRLDEADLKKISSGLSFCKSFSLNQPKLSKIMTTLNASSLIELKQKIKEIPMEWWLYSFDNPVTKRKMRPFFTTAQYYYSNDLKYDQADFNEVLNEIKNQFPKQSCEGPTTVAQFFSELVQDEFTLWITQSIANVFKKKFKLIPGTKNDHKVWKVATMQDNPQNTEIMSHFPRENYPTANVIRAIWDLGFSDARSNEVRYNLLRKFLK